MAKISTKTFWEKVMNDTELKLLDLVREMLAKQSNQKLKDNNFQHTGYTQQLEKTIQSLTELKRFH